MNMTNEEIIREYRNAKKPGLQIGILADENECARKDIAKILMGAGLDVPGIYRPGRRAKRSRKPDEEPAQAAEEPDLKPLALEEEHKTVGTTVRALVAALHAIPQDATIAEGFDTIRVISDINFKTGKASAVVSIGCMVDNDD